MRAFLLAGAAALALGGTAAAQSSTPAVIGSPQGIAQSGQTSTGGMDVGRSGSANMATGQTTAGSSTMSGSTMTPGAETRGTSQRRASMHGTSGGHHNSSAMRSSSGNRSSNAAARGGRDIDPPATEAQLRREEARQRSASRSTRPEDRAFMGGGMILENGRPVGGGDFAGSASMPTNAMGGSMGAIQPGPAGRMGSGNNAGTTPGGGR